MTLRLSGGSDLRARLANLATVPDEFARTWAKETADQMRKTAPNARRPASRIFTTKILRLRAAVYGAYWWIFVDRGTKAHEITGAGGSNPPNILMFEVGGKTIFRSQVEKKRGRRRPFISRAAQGALAGSKWADSVIKQWNGRRLRGPHTSFL